MTVRVQQEHQWGCQVAVLAMLMGIDYKAALSYYPHDPDKHQGFGAFVLETILAEQGYAIARLYKVRTGFSNEERAIWPPKPFGPIHWCQVETSAGAHAIIMLSDGRVLDPWTDTRTTLDHPDYLKVTNVTAVIPFTA